MRLCASASVETNHATYSKDEIIVSDVWCNRSIDRSIDRLIQTWFCWPIVTAQRHTYQSIVWISFTIQTKVIQTIGDAVAQTVRLKSNKVNVLFFQLIEKCSMHSNDFLSFWLSSRWIESNKIFSERIQIYSIGRCVDVEQVDT